MYRKESEGWFKHIDFILIDTICLQVAFYLAYVLKGLGVNPYADLVYRNMAIVLEFADLATMFMLDTLCHVTQRGRYRELIATLGNVAVVGLLGIAYLFVMQEGEAFSVMDTSFQVLMCLDGYGEVQTMDAEQKPMRFSKGETLFLPAGLGRCLVVGDAELLKIRC